MMKTKKNSKVEAILIVILLIIAILSEVIYIPFKDYEIQKTIFWINFRIFHIGVIPAYVLYKILKTKTGKFLGCVLLISTYISLSIELFGVFVNKDFITKINSYWYSEFLFIFVSIILATVYELNKNGVLHRIYRKFYSFLSLL